MVARHVGIMPMGSPSGAASSAAAAAAAISNSGMEQQDQLAAELASQVARPADEARALPLQQKLGTSYKGRYTALKTSEEQVAWRDARAAAVKELTKQLKKAQQELKRAKREAHGNEVSAPAA